MNGVLKDCLKRVVAIMVIEWKKIEIKFGEVFFDYDLRLD